MMGNTSPSKDYSKDYSNGGMVSKTRWVRLLLLL